MQLLLFFPIFQACDSPPPSVEPSITVSSPSLRRLTVQQFHNSLQDLFGETLVLPVSLEPDTEVDGLLSIGASISSVSPAGVERYESAAFMVAEQVISDESIRDNLINCDFLESPTDCYSVFVDEFGSKIWRRPLIMSLPQWRRSHGPPCPASVKKRLLLNVAALISLRRHRLSSPTPASLPKLGTSQTWDTLVHFCF